MYDSIYAKNIPTDTQMVAGYIDAGPNPVAPPWSGEDWARFPDAVKVRIATQPATNDGHVLDVENGDATPEDAPGWVLMRRQAEMEPSVYCSESIWPTVRQAFRRAGVPEPQYWTAGYPGSVGAGNLYPGSVAHQYVDEGDFDLSIVADYWPGVDDEDDMLPEDRQMLAEIHGVLLGAPEVGQKAMEQTLNEVNGRVNGDEAVGIKPLVEAVTESVVAALPIVPSPSV